MSWLREVSAHSTAMHDPLSRRNAAYPAYLIMHLHHASINPDLKFGKPTKIYQLFGMDTMADTVN